MSAESTYPLTHNKTDCLLVKFDSSKTSTPAGLQVKARLTLFSDAPRVLLPECRITVTPLSLGSDLRLARLLEARLNWLRGRMRAYQPHILPLIPNAHDFS